MDSPGPGLSGLLRVTIINPPFVVSVMRRVVLTSSFLLVLLCACAPLPSPSPVAVPPDWVGIGERRLPAQVFGPMGAGSSSEPIAWEAEPVAWVWEGGWPQYQGFTLPAGLRPMDVAFLDVGGRVHELFHAVSCSEGRPAGCALSSQVPAASILVLEAGLAHEVGIRKSTLVRVERSDRVVEIETTGVGHSGRQGVH